MTLGGSESRSQILDLRSSGMNLEKNYIKIANALSMEHMRDFLEADVHLL